jgi:hypothetical protein
LPTSVALNWKMLAEGSDGFVRLTTSMGGSVPGRQAPTNEFKTASAPA